MNPMEQSPTVVIGRRVQVGSGAIRVGAPTPAKPARQEPKIQLIREDGIIQAIDVTCGCGEKIRIRCDYTDTPTAEVA